MPTINWSKFNILTTDYSDQVHDFKSGTTHAFTVALMAAANPPAAGNSVLADLTQISYTNLSSRVLSSVTGVGASGVFTFDAADLVLTASGTVATWRYIAIYNDTPTSPADPLIFYSDWGSDVTMQNSDTVTLTFHASGIFTLT